MDEDTAPAYYAISADNHASWVVAASIIFLIYSIIGVVGKILLRINLTYIKTPDIFLIICLIALVIETAFVICACKHGLGQHTAVLDTNDFTKYSKYMYAASIFAISIQAATKISVCLLISAISPQFKLLLANRILMGLIVVWAFSGIFAVAFACGLPHPWRGDGQSICQSREAIQIYNGIFNILSDLAICILPIVMMWDVQTSTKRKASVCALFGSRILVPAFTIPFLATSKSYYENMQTDPTWYAVVPTILAQISLNLSVLTACIPGLKSLLESLLSGIALARVQDNYDLTTSGDKGAGLTTTPVLKDSQNSKHSRSGSGLGSHSRSRNSLVAKVAQRLRPEGSQRELAVSSNSHEHEKMRKISNDSRGVAESERTLHDIRTDHSNRGIIIRTDQYEISSLNRNSLTGPEYRSRISSGDRDDIEPANARH